MFTELRPLMSGSQVLAVRAEWKKRDIMEVIVVR
jgi:hypothetical protein